MKLNRKPLQGVICQPRRHRRENVELFYAQLFRVQLLHVQLFSVGAAARLILVLGLLGVASCAFAQVIFMGASSPVTAELPPGTDTVTVTQTIPLQTNGVLVIGVSMNNQQSPTSTVTGITDNGSAVGIFKVGAVGTSPAKSRVEIWALKSPPTGLNTIVITIPVSAPTVGVVATSADFSQVSQTTPFETFGSNTGSGNASSPTVTVTSAAGEIVIDTVATAPSVTLTAATGQTQEWQTKSGVASTDTEGAGSIKAGSTPTATMTWTHTGAASWAIGAVSIRSSILTAVAIHRFEAYSSSSGTLLMWQVGQQAQNLGFNVYRDAGSGAGRVRLNPSLIAGSALQMSGALPQHSGKTYRWIDSSPSAGRGGYWLEDVDVNGTRTMHGPVSAVALASAQAAGEAMTASSPMFNQLNELSQLRHPVENVLQDFRPTSSRSTSVRPTLAQRQKQFELAAHRAVKIFVKDEGWHRVTQPELVTAGLDPNVDPALLHLYAEALEQPIQITGADAGSGGFGPSAAINFYGTGIDTPYSDTRVYWLVAGEGTGRRIHRLRTSSGSNQPPATFPATVELAPRTTYFAALITSNGNNFFGPLVSSTPAEQIVQTPHLDKTSTDATWLGIILQGVMLGAAHDVTIVLNGAPVGNLTFTGQDQGSSRVRLPPGLLKEGNNTVTLTAQGGENDTSLVESVRITYPHLYMADSDQLKFTGRAGDEVTVGNFDSTPTVLDITDPNRPVQLTPRVISISMSGKYEIAVQVPFTTTDSAAPVRHRLLAVADDRVASASGVWANHPSHWHSPQAGADIAMVTYGAFEGTLAPLVRAHHAEGKSSAVVPVNDLYDEFNFGERTPWAIRQFLQTANQNWKKPPAYLLLNGRASLDPRNYLGFGNLDLVPTRIVPSTSLMTASDDWFSDFNDSGMPTIATGRLPVGSVEEAVTVVGKIATYEGQSTNGSWTANALMVADKSDTENFTQDSQMVQAKLPATMRVTDVFVDTVGTTAAPGDILNAINAGQVLVNYLGHGSEEQWSGSNIFDATSVSSLTNGSQLPVFLMMDCLNGFFQDVYFEPLGVALMLATNGGAVAVLASSGLNDAPPQTNLDALIVQNVLNVKGATLGDAIVKAKLQISDPDVRRTFVLFGDPAMQVKQPSANATVE